MALPFTEGLVAIHDGVRPFVSEKVIQSSFEEAAKSGSAIPVVSLKDSLRKVNAGGESTFQERTNFRLVQTPQTFQVERLMQAIAVEELEIFTDDATVYEYQGWAVTLIEGNAENIKLTTPEDLVFAEFLMATRWVEKGNSFTDSIGCFTDFLDDFTYFQNANLVLNPRFV